MIEQLFGSKTRVKLLQLFYSNPNRSFYVREITRKIDEQINSVRRELANLLSIGIIVSDNTNNRLYYEVNQKYEFYKPMLAIFGHKAMALPKDAKKPEGETADKLKSMGNIELMIYAGQFTRDESSGIDALIVGDVNTNSVQKFISDLENQEGKELRYAVMTRQEFEYRRQIKDRFILTLLGSKIQVVVDKAGLIKA
ncbi:MAG TPA: hypothetical protein VFK47_07745 [Ktedonobacteraceae bacterium]|nr:hypothetical protein [Ktedonobacteraceae bacterium]